MKVDLYTQEGAGAGKKVDLPASIFEVEPNDHLIYQAVVTEMTNRRIGSHSGKNRSAKRGGGAKPWRQKGTGRARAGTTRSPIWVGGGIAFPPQPHEYKQRMNKKAKQNARKSAFAYRAKENGVKVIEDIELTEPNTKRIATLIKDMELDNKKVLLLTSDHSESLYLSVRNLQNVALKNAASASTYDILDAEVLLLTQSGLESLASSLGTEKA